MTNLTPWTADHESGRISYLWDADNKYIGVTNDKDDAELICAAVNSYDRLKNIERAAKELLSWKDGDGCVLYNELSDNLKRALEAE